MKNRHQRLSSHKSILHQQSFIKQMSKSIQGISEEECEDGPDFYEVEEILNRKQTLKGTLYLIKWKGYPNPSDYTWEPLEHLRDVMHMVEEFDQKKETMKKKIKKEYHERVFKGGKKIQQSIQIGQQSQNRFSQVNSVSVLSSEKKARRNGKVEKKEKEEKAKEKEKKESYMPKIVKINTTPEKKNFEKKHSHNSGKDSQKHKQKDETDKYLVKTTLNKNKVQNNRVQISQNIQNQRKYWFNIEPYKLGSILRHTVQNENIYFFCDVETVDGELCCVIKLSESQLESISSELQKEYILEHLIEVKNQEMKQGTPEHREVEDSWRS